MHESHRKQAARTTIVGGQPPGNARLLPPVPAGLEELLSLAAASPEFAEALLRDRTRTAQAADISLSPAEGAILDAVDEASLSQMISRVGSALPQPDRRAFFERAAAAVAILVGGQALSGCGEKKTSSKHPCPAPPEPGARDAGQAARPAPCDRPRKRELDVDGGARPDRVPVPQGIRPDPPPRAPTTGIRPDRSRPPEEPVITGIRPDRVDPGRDSSDEGEGSTPIGGVRPTRPSSPTPRPSTTGIRPDRR